MITHFLITNYNILTYSIDLFLLINLIVYFVGFSKSGKAHKIFTIYLLVIFIGEMISKLMVFNKYENISMSHYYFISQFILLSLFYLEILILPLQKTIIRFLMVLIPIVLTIQYLVYPELIFKFNLIEVFLCSFSIVVYAVFHFYNMLNHKRLYYFINSGLLIYLFGSTIIFLSGNVLIIKSKAISCYLGYINVFLYLFYLTMIFIEWKKNYSTIK